MKLDIFTKKALEKEFPFLKTLFDGTLRKERCQNCGKEHEFSYERPFSEVSPCCGTHLENIVKKVREISPENVTIKKVDETFLNSVPQHHGWSGSLVDIDQGTEIIFVLNDGTIIRNAVNQDIESGSNYAYTDTYKRNGETVLAAIERLGIVDLTHIIEREYGIHTTDHHSHGVNMVIRKVTIPIGKLINKEREQAEEKIKARLSNYVRLSNAEKLIKAIQKAQIEFPSVLIWEATISTQMDEDGVVTRPEEVVIFGGCSEDNWQCPFGLPIAAPENILVSYRTEDL